MAEASATWLGDKESLLEGFQWKGGSERDTNGILLWSEPFILELSSSEKVAVLLMDTQGVFDSQSTVTECAVIFALSTLISSVQVFNLSGNIQENDLQHLQLFTDYGRQAMKDNGAKPFQHLLFLVRDWQNPYEYAYGEQGGELLLNKRLKNQGNQHEEHRQLRDLIFSWFDRIGCFLMPYPGKNVATNRNFCGRLADIDDEFIQHAKDLVPLLLSPQNLVVKRINENNITGEELVKYFEAYIEIFKGGNLPELTTIFQATAKANNLSAVAKATKKYEQGMEEVCQQYMEPDDLIHEHENMKNIAIDEFNTIAKMGGPDVSKEYEEELGKYLDGRLQFYIHLNASKEGVWNKCRKGLKKAGKVAMKAAWVVLPSAQIGLTTSLVLTELGIIVGAGIGISTIAVALPIVAAVAVATGIYLVARKRWRYIIPGLDSDAKTMTNQKKMM